MYIYVYMYILYVYVSLYKHLDTGGRLGVHKAFKKTLSDNLWVSCVLSTNILCRWSQTISLSYFYLLKVDLD